jgi:Na+-transporting NADH:ubiquinone oxidoreductase subunit NqrC
MSHINFIILLVVLYAIYYLANIVYDIIQQKKLQNTASSQNNVLDVSDLVDNEYSPIDASTAYQQRVENESKKDDDTRRFMEHQEQIHQNEDEVTIQASEDSVSEPDNTVELSSITEEISNVTNHGGYSVPQLKKIFNEVSSGGNNPLLGITSKMM